MSASCSNIQAFYINLDSCLDRRLFVESNFKAFSKSNWCLTRVPAIDAQQVQSSGVVGCLTPAEMACFLSHGKAIKSSLSHEGHALILEDDVFFGPSSLGLIDSALEVIETNEWDILFTDICVPRTQWMVTLFEKRRELLAEQRFELYELHERVFAGATAYLVHEKSKEKVLAALSGLDELNTPYDLFLRSCIHKRMIKGFVVFPFATSLSDFAESSQIQERKTQLTDSAWNAFRRMMWVDAERMGIDPVARLESTPASYFDEQSQNFLKILGVQLSANFVAK